MESNAITRLKRLAGKSTLILTHYGRKSGLHFLAAPLATSALAPANGAMDGFQRFVTGRALRGDAG